MQHGMVDIAIVGADRVTANGDVCNKIGTYLKALAARDNGVPFYVGLPYPSIDWTIEDGRDIPIEERHAREVSRISGRTASGSTSTVTTSPLSLRPAMRDTSVALRSSIGIEPPSAMVQSMLG